MIQHEINDKKNFISGWYTDEFQLCDDLMKFARENEKRLPGRVNLPDGTQGVDLDIKNSIDSKLEDSPDLMKRYFGVLQRCLIEYSKQYEHGIVQVSLGVLEGANIQLYPQGGGFKPFHWERSHSVYPQLNRYLVYMTYLNDITEGGETEFFYQGVKITPRKGLTLIWPSDWPFTHRGIPAMKEEKVIVTGWLSLVVRV